MNYAVHFFNPIQPTEGRYIHARCGRSAHATKETMMTTTDVDKVTCIKCKNYINNPIRILRKYGTVRNFKDIGFFLLAGNNFKVNLIVYPNFQDFTVVADIDGKIIIEIKFDAIDINDAMNKVIEIYESELIKMQI